MSCIDKLKEQFPQLTHREAKRLVDTMDMLKQKYVNEVSLYKKMAKSEVDNQQVYRLRKQKAAVHQVIKLKNNLEHVLHKGFENNPVEGLLSRFEGTSRIVPNKAYTVENIYATSKAKLQGTFSRGLEADKVLGEFGTGQLDELVIREIEGRTIPGHKPSADPSVRKIADHIEKINKQIIKEQQLAGSTIRGRAGYIMQQSYDPEVVLANPGKWVDDMMDSLDLQKSFGNLDNKVIREELVDMAENMEDIGFSLSNHMGGKRELIFKEGEFFRINEQYGYHNLLAGVMRSIDVASKKVALTEIFGNNPKLGLEELISKVAETQPGLGKLKQMQKVRDALDYFSGSGNRFMDANSIGAKSYSTVRAAKTLNAYRLLGGTGFTALNDIASTMVTLRNADGSNAVSSIAKSTLNFIANAPVRNKKQFAETMLIGLEDISREVMESVGSSEYKPSLGSKAMNTWMNLNLTNPVTRTARTSALKLHAKSLTNSIETPIGKRNKFQQTAIETAGLSEIDIDNLKKMKEKGGEQFVNPTMVLHDDFKGIKVEGEADRYRQVLSTKLGAYLNDVVRKASPIAGNKEMRQMLRHKPKDDAARIVMEVVSEYKGTLLKSQSVYGEFTRLHSKNGSLKLDNWNAVQSHAQYLFALGIVGFSIKSLKDFIKGKEFEEVNAQTMTSAIIETGAAGLYADLVMEMVTRDGRSRGSTPIIQGVDGLVRSVNRGLKGKAPVAADKLKGTVLGLMPMQNWWVIDAVKNHIIKEGAYRSRRGTKRRRR